MISFGSNGNTIAPLSVLICESDCSKASAGPRGAEFPCTRPNNLVSPNLKNPSGPFPGEQLMCPVMDAGHLVWARKEERTSRPSRVFLANGMVVALFMLGPVKSKSLSPKLAYFLRVGIRVVLPVSHRLGHSLTGMGVVLIEKRCEERAPGDGCFS